MPSCEKVKILLDASPASAYIPVMTSAGQARKDAMADAETLAQSGVMNVSGDTFFLVVAALMGVRAVNAIHGVAFKTHGAAHEATQAARAAFRAVPGLRG